MSKDLSLFDVMTNISNFSMLAKKRDEDNMYNCVDWDSIKEQIKEYDSKV